MTALYKYILAGVGVSTVLLMIMLAYSFYSMGYDAAVTKYSLIAFRAQNEAITRTRDLQEHKQDFQRRRYELENRDKTCKDIFDIDISRCLGELRGKASGDK